MFERGGGADHDDGHDRALRLDVVFQVYLDGVLQLKSRAPGWLGRWFDHCRSLEPKAGFYQNSCRCLGRKSRGTCWGANLAMALNFDGVKVDSCGSQRDVAEWAAEFSKLARRGVSLGGGGRGAGGIC